jgi:lactate dehydrogenase-like 2-hydroxyacid dehydrogenase
MSTRKKVLLTRRWPKVVEDYLAERFDVTLNVSDTALTTAELSSAMREYDCICSTVTDSFTATVLSTPQRRVQLLGNFGVGVNHIDIEAAKAAGLRVSNTPDVLTDATSDLAICLMLMTTRRAGEGERQLRAGQWFGWHPTHLMGHSLQGKVLGLIGFGRIAQATARKAHLAFGMRIAYNGRRRAALATEQETSAEFFDSVDELLISSDIVSLHCPGGAATHHLINAERLRRMKRSAVLINTARGSVVDENALVEALTEKRIAAAGLDVFEQEPQVHPGLVTLENVVLLPHLGSATEETRVAMGMRVARNLEAFFAGQPLCDPVV